MAIYKDYRDYRSFLGLSVDELMKLPIGTTLQRPTGGDLEEGLLRVNTTTHAIEWYENGIWNQSGGTYNDALAQDAIGSILQDTDTIDFIYNDPGTAITANVKDNSITFSKIQNIDTAGILGRYTGGIGDVQEIAIGDGLFLDSMSGILSSTITQYTDENAQDALAAIVADTLTINFTYTDATPQLKADVLVGAANNSLTDFMVWDGTSIKLREFDSMCKDEIEIRFRVGDSEYPQDDESVLDTSTLSSPIDLTDKRIRVYREGERQFEGDLEYGIDYNSTTGVITFYPNLAVGERIIVEAEALNSCLSLYEPGLAPLVASTVNDDGYYNGFPFPHQFDDGTIISAYKKGGDHASLGDLTLAKSNNGGTSWTGSQITIGVTAIEVAALSIGVIPTTERLLLAYQDDELYTTIKFAYSDNKGLTWTAAGTIAAPHAGAYSPSPIKMIVLPSGKILCAYYCFNPAGTATVGFIESTNSGVSWAIGDTICANNGSGFGDNKGHEVAVAITHNTGVDATCKMIALVRNADAGPMMFYYSADGGENWATDLVSVDNPGAYSRHYFYPYQLSAAQPVDIIVRSGVVYVVCGYRPTADYRLTYVTATANDAYENNFHNWSALTDIVDFNATTLAADIDCGYPVCFIDWQNKIWCHYYDVSTEPVNLGITTDRCWIKQIKIAD